MRWAMTMGEVLKYHFKPVDDRVGREGGLSRNSLQ